MLHTKFQASEPSGSEDFLYLSISMHQTQDPLGLGHFAPWNLQLNRDVKELFHIMLYTKLQASEPCASKEEDFLIFFLCISMLQTHDHLGRSHFAPWGLHLDKIGKGTLGTAKF